MPSYNDYERIAHKFKAVNASRQSSDVRNIRTELIKSGEVMDDSQIIAEMRANRRINKSASGGYPNGGGGQGPSVSFASGRPRDPMFYWKENNLPYDITKVDELEKIRAFCRLLYITHPVISSAIDIFSKYPILDMEFKCKDEKLTDFYSDLFLEQLEYEDFLIDVGREYWTVGEAWPLGSFNETLGVWESDELLNPDDIKVVRSPFLKEPRFEMKLPETIRDIIINRQPKWEYEALIRAYPEMLKFTREDSMMPVSNILLKQLKFKGDSFHPRGIPILMRGFRALIQEEMLNAAQDAIAERLYTPMIVARLGASATDLGTSVPWVPTEDDLQAFEYALDAALAGDFRVLITHFATQIEPVFGKEILPDFGEDFDRLTDRELQIFGLSKTMLSGAGEGETYAADAMNRDLVSQLLTTYQRKVKKLVTDRMKVVAEAQEHYDYEERAGIKYPLMEEVLETDPETGEQTIVEQPKLLVPDIIMKTMNMQDETTEQQFKEALRESGVPISIRTRLVNVPINLQEEIEVSSDEQVELAVADAETKKKTYLALRAENLPIPPDLRALFEPKAQEVGKGNPMVDDEEEEDQPPVPMPTLGLDTPPNVALAPTPEDLEAADDAEGQDASGPPGLANADGSLPGPAAPAAEPTPTQKLPTNKWKQRPPESDEMRANMPKGKSAGFLHTASIEDIEAAYTPQEGDEEDGPPTEVIPAPWHIGMRRTRQFDPNVPLDEQLDQG